MKQTLNPSVQQLIDRLRLVPHPEGGFYRETHRSPLEIESPRHGGMRHAFTSIHFLLAGGQYSAWHRVASEESWFFHQGCDLEVHSLLPFTDTQTPVVQTQRIGAACGRFELTIPANCWFAAEPVEADSYTLVSCVVAPGFVFEDFELASRQHLIDARYHQTHQWPMIESLLVSK